MLSRPIMAPLPSGMLVELVKHAEKELGWASTASFLLTHSLGGSCCAGGCAYGSELVSLEMRCTGGAS